MPTRPRSADAAAGEPTQWQRGQSDHAGQRAHRGVALAEHQHPLVEQVVVERRMAVLAQRRSDVGERQTGDVDAERFVEPQVRRRPEPQHETRDDSDRDDHGLDCRERAAALARRGAASPRTASEARCRSRPRLATVVVGSPDPGACPSTLDSDDGNRRLRRRRADRRARLRSLDQTDHQIVVIGAGPAGLTAAYELGKAGVPATVLESDAVVGGISRTVERDGWRFDIGGHRFFTKVRAVEDLWHEILPDDDFLLRPRMSRIYYEGKYYDYPLRAFNVLRKLGIIEAFRCLFSYLWVQVRPPKDQTTFEGWTAARFGWRLYRMLLQDLHREGVGRAGHARSRPTGRPSASRT